MMSEGFFNLQNRARGHAKINKHKLKRVGWKCLEGSEQIRKPLNPYILKCRYIDVANKILTF